MVTMFGKFFESIGSFCGGDDQIPWCDHDDVMRCVIEAGDPHDSKSDSFKKLSWALVHSREPRDVWRGTGMLEASLDFDDSSLLEQREQLYLLAIAYYRSGDYSRSLQRVLRCLEISPDLSNWRQALTLKKTIEDKIAKDDFIGKARIAITAVALLAGGIAVALARKN